MNYSHKELGNRYVDVDNSNVSDHKLLLPNKPSNFFYLTLETFYCISLPFIVKQIKLIRLLLGGSEIYVIVINP